MFQVKIDLQSFLLLMSKFAFGNNVKNFFVCVEYKFHAHSESCQRSRVVSRNDVCMYCQMNDHKKH